MVTAPAASRLSINFQYKGRQPTLALGIPQELFTASGTSVMVLGFPSGSEAHCKASISTGQVALMSMALAAIHWASIATPTVSLVLGEAAHIIPMVAVPCPAAAPILSTGNGFL